MNFYPFHLGDYSSHTKHLTLLEDLAYRRMLDLYYTLEKPLPSEPEKVARLIGMRDNIREVSDVLSDFFLKSEDGYRNSRCDKEIEIYKAKAERAKSANKSRWSANKSDSDVKSDMKSESNQIPTNNQEPLTKNQEPLISNTDVLLVSSESENQKRKPDCPHQQIIDLYHEVLPQCPRIRDWTPARQQQLRARWNEDEKRQNLEYWKKLFEYISTCDFLVGKSGQKPFFADLEWITKSANFTKIREQKYENRK